MQGIFFLILAYGLGSVNSAVLLSRVCALPDPRTTGSHNPGATNMLRIAGKQYALVVLLCDVLKGVVPVLLALLSGVSVTMVAFCCFAAVIGHIYPVFFHFKGGKGVATALGSVLALHFVLGVSVILTWFLVLAIGGYSSLASIITIILLPFYASFMVQHAGVFIAMCFIALFILYQHRNNITRLMDGTEPKVTFKQNNIPEMVDKLVDMDVDEETCAEPPKTDKKAKKLKKN